MPCWQNCFLRIITIIRTIRTTTSNTDTLNLQGLQFPLAVRDVERFERQNSDISVNVLYYDEDSKSFTIEYLSHHHEREKHVNLLLLEDSATSKHHYITITNMSRLVAGRTKTHQKAWVCSSCSQPFSSQHVLDAHTPLCRQHEPQQVIYPNADDPDDCVLKFRARNKQHKLPFFLIADMESFLVPLDGDETDLSSNQRIIDEHQISGFASYRVTAHGQYQTPPFVYSGPDPLSKFYDHVMSESRTISHVITQNVSMLALTDEQVRDYDSSTVCKNCNGGVAKKNPKVHHHCHVSGKYLAAVCNNCNLQLRPRKCSNMKRHHMTAAERAAESYEQDFFLPVVFHNLKCYDGHFILRSFERKHVERRTRDNKAVYGDIFVTP